jgi:TetR/AcrR family transcriptional regulator, regulator of autoinduction and epiphytic fitness
MEKIEPVVEGVGTVSADGRRARAERSRDAVVDAILELLNEGVDRPSVAEIAERAGVSPRSIFRYFDDLESLFAAAIERHLERIRPLFVVPAAHGDTSDRVRSLVRKRADFYEAITPVRRTAERLRERSSVIEYRIERAHETLRQQLVDLFAAELNALDPAEAREVLDGIDLATSWRAWHTMRTEQGCSRRRASAVTERIVLALLSRTG